ncbi:MAG: hypothetical protein ACREQ7_06805 [Candidatus Binatia bacterium]
MDDPKAMARWAKEMGRTMADETGEELSGDFDEMMEAAARMPKETTTKAHVPRFFCPECLRADLFHQTRCVRPGRRKLMLAIDKYKSQDLTPSPPTLLPLPARFRW